MEFLSDYGLFFLKIITVLLAFGILFSIVMDASQRRPLQKGFITISDLGEVFRSYKETMESEILTKNELKEKKKQIKKEEKKNRKETRKKDKTRERKKRIFVLDFDGDIRASSVDSLRNEISAVLFSADPDAKDEVLVRLESSGGIVHGYGLAASQLRRLREKGIRLVVAVDKVAASGGYLMACVAEHLIAAPFAVIGSIGVIAQLPNFNRFLKKHEIDFEQVTAGQYKRTLSLFGENTEEGRKKLESELEDMHVLFQKFVSECRPGLDMEKVSTGEIWYGVRAMDVGLVDEIRTSDDYLVEQKDEADIYQVRYMMRRSLKEKFSASGAAAYLSRLLFFR